MGIKKNSDIHNNLSFKNNDEKQNMKQDIKQKDFTEADSAEIIAYEVKKSLSSDSKSSLIKLLIGILLAASVIMFFGGVMKYNELQSQRKRLESEVADLEAEIDELQFLIDSPVDYDYIVRVAREKLNLYLPDEIIYYSDINE